MKQYRIEGALTYLLFCPKAPELDQPCAESSHCEGHEYQVPVDLYVIAPDETRAVLQAYGKLKAAYPWPLFADAPPDVFLIERPTAVLTPQGPRLPGFEGL